MTTRYAELSRVLAGEIIRQIELYNRETRRSKARAEREFGDKRLADVGAELRAAEDAEREWLKRNRGDYQAAPDLRVEHDRLSRQVAFLEQMYATVGQGRERARMDEVRDTPALTIIDAAEVPALPLPRGRLR